MSIKHMQRVWDSSETKGGARLAMLAVADFADDLGYCWPSIATIANMIRMSTRQTQRILKEASEMGEIEIDRSKGGRRSNRYLLTVGASLDEICKGLTSRMGYDAKLAETVAGLLLEWQAANRTDDILSPQDLGVTKCHRRGDTHVTAPLTRMSPDPLTTPKLEDEDEETNTFWTSPRKPLTHKAGKPYPAENGTTDASAILVSHMQSLIDQPNGLLRKYKEAAGITVLGDSDRATITAWVDFYRAKEAAGMDHILACKLAYNAIRDANPAPVQSEPATVASKLQEQATAVSSAWGDFLDNPNAILGNGQ